MELKSGLSLADICRELGFQPQFLLDLAEAAPAYYNIFETPKRSGGVRKISASQGRLKRTQRLLLHGVLEKLPMPSHVHGCVKDRSIVTNAREHVHQEIVVNIDLSDFFGTISVEMVEALLKRYLACDDHAARTISKLTTFNDRLPQGAPTSPVIANLAALELDQEIMRVCIALVGEGTFGYSRYVDDITISGAKKLVDALPDIHATVEKCGFKLNSQKTKILRQSNRQWVTGIVVNRKLSTPKTLIRKIRQHLYYCQKYGVRAHADWKGLEQGVLVRILRGQIGYLRMTQPELADRFVEELDELVPIEFASRSPEELLFEVLKNIIENEQAAKFTYEKSERMAAPTEIDMDDDGFLQLRAFQLAPKLGWETYRLSSIENLKAHRLT